MQAERHAIEIVRRGQRVRIDRFAPTETLLDYLRLRERATGTKEGCAEGDCGACTVALGRPDGQGGVSYRPVNACIQLLGMADGAEVVTVEDLADGDCLHPIQQAFVDHHASQCGFCTPGFVMALFALYHTAPDGPVDRAGINNAIAGNLCRCTGYRPIIEAARAACGTAVDYTPGDKPARTASHDDAGAAFHAPGTLAELLALRAAHPDAMLLSGGTDLGLSVSKDRKTPGTVIHTAHVAELRDISESDDALTLGAAVTYTEALPYLDRLYPSFAEMIRRIGSRQIRNLGTLGGNIGNASPIGDTPPCLIALDATLTLASDAGQREVALEDFFLDYRKTDLKLGEVIVSIRIPKFSPSQDFRTYKVSKRYDQDISAVIGAFRLDLDGNTLKEVRIAFGGMAATPRRAAAAEAALTGAAWSEEGAAASGARVSDDFAPIDDHRASAAYRSRVASNLFVRLYRDLAGTEAELDVVGL